MSSYKQLEWTPENLAKFWDYESSHPENYFTYQFGDTMVGEFGKYLKKGARALDYGCGTGFIIPHLLKSGAVVTGVDFSPKSVKFVNDKFKGERGFAGAFLLDDLVKEKSTFDVIFVVEVVEHLSDHYLEETVKNVKHMLSPGGVAIFTTPNDEDLSASQIFCPSCEKVFHRWQHVRSWTKNSLSNYLATSGMEIVKSYTTDFSASFKKNKINYLKSLIKKVINRKPPHLVCITKRICAE